MITLAGTVKLANGNLASRVIPVKIHDIDTEDVKLLGIRTLRCTAIH